jgi:hypothetical protein
MAYTCPKICTFTGPLMVMFPVGLAQRYHIQKGTTCQVGRAVWMNETPPTEEGGWVPLAKGGLARAELRPDCFFEGADDSCGKIIDLRVGERGFMALKRHAHEQRIFSRGHVFPAE